MRSASLLAPEKGEKAADLTQFGLPPLVAPGENCPTFHSQPLLFICQLDLRQAPVVPDPLQGY